MCLLAARPAHIVNAALFPGARLHDATAVYQNDTKARRPADRFLVSPSVRLIQTPGHHPDDLTLLVATPRGIVAVTHLWSSRSDGTQRPPDGDPGTLRRAKTRVLGVASRIVPAHGAAFRAGRIPRCRAVAGPPLPGTRSPGHHAPRPRPLIKKKKKKMAPGARAICTTRSSAEC